MQLTEGAVTIGRSIPVSRMTTISVDPDSHHALTILAARLTLAMNRRVTMSEALSYAADAAGKKLDAESGAKDDT